MAAKRLLFAAIPIASVYSYVGVKDYNYRRLVNVYNSMKYVESMCDDQLPQSGSEDRSGVFFWIQDLAAPNKKELSQSMTWFLLHKLPEIQGRLVTPKVEILIDGTKWIVTPDTVTRYGSIVTRQYDIIHAQPDKTKVPDVSIDKTH